MTLPSGFKEIVYAESTGTQYINTLYKGNLETEVECRGAVTSNAPASQPQQFFGDNTTSTLAITSQMANQSGAITRFGDKSFTRKMYAGADVFVTVKTNKTNYKVDDVVKGTFNTTTEYTTAGNMYLFGANGSTPALACVKLNYCKIWDNATLVRYFVPCIRSSDSAVGMYDLVTNTFYGNSGTGTFIAGPVVHTNTIKVYNGSEWVDGTPYVYTENGWVEADTVYVYTTNGWVEKD